jgi:hypothetical protein
MGTRPDYRVQHRVIGHSYLLSSLDIFYCSGGLLTLLILLCWFVPRPPDGAAIGSAG